MFLVFTWDKKCGLTYTISFISMHAATSSLSSKAFACHGY